MTAKNIMKKIGVLHGKERSFPNAFIERVNSKNIPGVIAESVHIDKAINLISKRRWATYSQDCAVDYANRKPKWRIWP